jgi:hypothetical protein
LSRERGTARRAVDVHPAVEGVLLSPRHGRVDVVEPEAGAAAPMSIPVLLWRQLEGDPATVPHRGEHLVRVMHQPTAHVVVPEVGTPSYLGTHEALATTARLAYSPRCVVVGGGGVKSVVSL